jgi:hypothetical protein
VTAQDAPHPKPEREESSKTHRGIESRPRLGRSAKSMPDPGLHTQAQDPVSVETPRLPLLMI